MSGGFDPRTYGRGFADIYDSWYPSNGDTDAAVAFISALCPPGARVLEVGIGTGRLALGLANAGHVVSGIDSSPEMLERLEVKARSSGVAMETSCGDVCSPEAWPGQRYDVVVAAFNFMFNLVGDDAKSAMLTQVASHLTRDGRLVVESYVPSDPPVAGAPILRGLEVRSVSAEAVVLIASETDSQSGIVTGQHIELRDGQPVTLRPWRVHVSKPEHVDRLALDAGLAVVERWGDWSGTPFDAESARCITCYEVADANG